MKGAWFLSSLLAIASVNGASAASGRSVVRLIEPAEHVAVIAGSTVPIAWEASGTPAGEEWEAFVSIDGGQTYPIRITPHLDVSIRRFTWTVPFLPGAEVSILLRFGDERDEQAFPFPSWIRVEGSVPPVMLRHGAVEASAYITSEKEDDHGELLFEWVDGSRDGGGLKQIVADESLLVDGPEWNRHRFRDPSAAIDSKRVGRVAHVSGTSMRRQAAARHSDGQVSRHRRSAVLVLSRRLNI